MAAALIAEELHNLRRSQQSGDSESTQQGRGKTVVDGRTIHYQDPASTQTAIKNIFEQRIYDFDGIRPAPRIIDAGAHIGIATLRFKQLHPEASILCFEPDPPSLALLRRNIEANQLNDVEIIQAALAENEGIAGFRADGADGGRLLPAASETCRTVRLSRFVSAPVDMLKLNIEGAEYAVLQELDAERKLSLIDRMVIEYHGWPGGEQSLGDILTLLAANGFRYLIHDFDQQTNPASKPPFRIRRNAPWFCLIYAERTGELRLQPPITSDKQTSIQTPAPISRVFGLDRGQPIDRYYIEKFLASYSAEIRGRVLEVADDFYTRRFGGNKVARSDVLHAGPGNKRSTIVADISRVGSLPSDTFDCIILTQTLHCIYDFKSAISNAHQALRHGGILLATLPGISQISRYDMERWGDFWRFTTLSARRVFDSVFLPGHVSIQAYGNVVSAQAFLQGQCSEEFAAAELDYFDRDFELLITVAAHKD